MVRKGQEVLEQAYQELESEVPDRAVRMLRWLRDPNSRHVRIPIGVLLILSSAFWFLPVLGIEFLPAGLLLLAQDVPFLRKPVGYAVIWLVRRWLALRRWWQSREPAGRWLHSQEVAENQGKIPMPAHTFPECFIRGRTNGRNTMVEGIKSVLIGLTKEFGPEEVSSALGYGLSLAQQAGAHATVQAASVRLDLSSAGISKVVGGLVQEENQRLRALAEAAARSAQADADAAGVVCSTAAPHLSSPELIAVFRAQARLHDLTIVDGEPEALTPDRGLIDALLMDSGRPLLVVPPGRDTFQARRVILAWDGSGRAARAAADALPFLRAAETVEVVAVMGEKDLPASVTGADIAPHLSRHGVNVSVQTLPALEGDVAETLRNHATLTRADMIVMGGYVHSRLRELVFGGVTQSLLRQSPVPLFMAY